MFLNPDKDISKRTFIIAAATVLILTSITLVFFGKKYLGNTAPVTEVSSDTTVSETETTEAVEEWEYISAADGVKITKYNGGDARVIIPESFDDSPVVEILDDAFSDNSVLVYVELPSTVKVIGANAFNYCTSLMSIKLSESLTTIGDAAFEGCSMLKSLELPSSVSDLGNYAFYNCSALSSITISDNLVNVGGESFGNTRWLENAGEGEIYLGNLLYSYVGDMPENYVLTVKEGTRVIATASFYSQNNLTSIVFPSTLKHISSAAFSGCRNLTSFVLPEGIRTVGSESFGGCTSITTIAIPKSVTNIGEAAFSACSALEKITVASDNNYYYSDSSALYSKDKTVLYFFCPANDKTEYTVEQTVSAIMAGAFYECKNLTSVELTEKITTIPAYTFFGCSALVSAKIPEGVTEIGEMAYSSCGNIVVAFLPSTLKSIGYAAFSACGSIDAFELAEDNETFTVVDNVVYSKNMKTLFNYPAGSISTSFTVPANVQTISATAFMHSGNLKSVELNSGLVTIDSEAFAYCAALTGITIPNSVTKIGDYCFSGCSELKKATLGSGLTQLAINAFSDCLAMKFFEVSNENTAYCSVDGVIYDASMETLLCYPSAKASVNFVIPDTVNTLKSYSFYSCSRLKKVTIPASVFTIEGAAFYPQTSIEEFEVSEDNTSFASIDGVITDYQKYRLITYPAGREDGSYTIPDGIVQLEDYAFWGCANLKNLTIPTAVEYFGANAISECEGMTVICEKNSKAMEYCETYELSYNIITQ